MTEDRTGGLGDEKWNSCDVTLAFHWDGWCEEAVNGEEFVNAYTNEFRDAFDTIKEYEESIADYVDCGTGELD